MIKRIILSVSLALLAGPAFAGQGWYLLGPPNDSSFVYPRAPLKHWDQVGAFDTTKDCEQARSTWRIRAKEDYERVKDDMRIDGTIRLNDRLRHEAMEFSRCIASDDPRLQ